MKTVIPTDGKDRFLFFIKKWGILLTCLLLFLISLLLYFYSSNQKEEVRINYLVMNKTIRPLEKITTKDVSLVSFPENSVPPKGIKEADASKVIGQKTLITLHDGDLLTPSFFGLQDTGKGNNIASIIPEGMRIEYFHVGDFHSIAPDLQKGNKLDIYGIPKSDDTKQNEAIRLLADIEVFDVIRGKIETGEGIQTIGLLLTDFQAQKITTYLTSDWKFQTILKPQSEKVIPTIEDENTPEQATGSAGTN
jgi:hypothetical protein